MSPKQRSAARRASDIFAADDLERDTRFGQLDVLVNNACRAVLGAVGEDVSTSLHLGRPGEMSITFGRQTLIYESVAGDLDR